jgi:hypothetical protein
MTKFLCTAKVVGQYMLNATTKQIDLIVPEIARTCGAGAVCQRAGQPLIQRRCCVVL